MKKALLFSVLLFSLSCNSTDSQPEEECGNDSIWALAHTLDSGLTQLILRNKNLADSSFVLAIISALDELKAIENDLVGQAGGVDPETWVLGDGCKKVPLDEITKISARTTVLSEKFENLKITYTRQKEQNLLNEFIRVLDDQILTNSISNYQYSEILIHILVQHNFLLTKMLDIYVFPEQS